MTTSRKKKVVPMPEHHPKCRASSMSTGYDWRVCGRCSVDAAQELLRLRAYVALDELKRTVVKA